MGGAGILENRREILAFETRLRAMVSLEVGFLVRVLLRLEGLAVCALAVYGYAASGGNWLWFAVFFLAPDLSMLGYVAGPRIGSGTYNLVHTYVTPAILVGIAWGIQLPVLLLAGLLLAAHIGVDRLLGFGLKYPSGFKDTHLQRI